MRRTAAPTKWSVTVKLWKWTVGAASAAATIGLLIALPTGPAHAAVDFDPLNGTGFAGKGDVQTAFGWSNKQLQDNASRVTFRYSQRTPWTAGCAVEIEEWEGTGKDKIQVVETEVKEEKKTLNINGRVLTEPRMKQQVSGFLLTGYTQSDTSEPVPQEGDACKAWGKDGTYEWVIAGSGSQSLSVIATGYGTPELTGVNYG
jgi:hypothetical protein